MAHQRLKRPKCAKTTKLEAAAAPQPQGRECQLVPFGATRAPWVPRHF